MILRHAGPEPGDSDSDYGSRPRQAQCDEVGPTQRPDLREPDPLGLPQTNPLCMAVHGMQKAGVRISLAPPVSWMSELQAADGWQPWLEGGRPLPVRGVLPEDHWLMSAFSCVRTASSGSIDR